MRSNAIRQQTVVTQVMGEMRNLIASGAYVPGDRIPTEKELAERFGVGRSSIREAIKIFNYLGILSSKAALGTFVRTDPIFPLKHSPGLSCWGAMNWMKSLTSAVRLNFGA